MLVAYGGLCDNLSGRNVQLEAFDGVRWSVCVYYVMGVKHLR